MLTDRKVRKRGRRENDGELASTKLKDSAQHLPEGAITFNGVASSMPGSAVASDLAFNYDLYALAVAIAFHIHASIFGASRGFNHDSSLGFAGLEIAACHKQVG